MLHSLLSSHVEGICVDAKGVTCTSWEILRAKKYLIQYFFEAISEIEMRYRYKLCYLSEFIVHYLCK